MSNMKCTNCGTENFEIAVKCARCHTPLMKSNPLFRNSPDPEPPTQISGVGIENVRFGPAPDPIQHSQPRKLMRPPSSNSQQRNAEVPTPKTPNDQSKPQKVPQNSKKEEPNVLLFGLFALSLGASFLFLCIDFYSFFLLLQNR